ncbi:hypothetical protein EV08_1381 [Prochlorococcus marinus str. SS2]|uniref:DUF2103 domain-containing protein n=1 Tax=Prochlorococcus TaxID=1218 RepID=UPI000533ABD7|nr:hypothetical protein EV08_1381 [Prochlorococcus marinus str. SS2]KGG23568.1 hypothetical protein EV09_1192 [Prochlorococcus marinus str. SS35]
MAKDEEIKTITPGVIARVRGNSGKLKIKITRKIKGGFKLIARKGKSAQEVYILTNYDNTELEDKINKLLT